MFPIRLLETDAPSLRHKSEEIYVANERDRPEFPLGPNVKTKRGSGKNGERGFCSLQNTRHFWLRIGLSVELIGSNSDGQKRKRRKVRTRPTKTFKSHGNQSD
ncbi:hypothetical protein EFP84_16525 [Leptospira kmetyi]|uniref:Uncharacterized protein n=1 Tax=Leptospira kmetyi TaxID=408139 RepID=A0AAD0UQP3_9LEPT|nr:hypothetical protein EFP84_16525 [Leptospira kmetyi]PJZ31674.1 hypothetical protein CH378_00195 [Leptospira kmetyi]